MLTFAIIAFVAAAPSMQTAATPNAPAPASAPPEEPKKICRRMAETGSNVRSKKVCLTARQWDQVARDSQMLGRSMQPSLTTPNQ